MGCDWWSQGGGRRFESGRWLCKTPHTGAFRLDHRARRRMAVAMQPLWSLHDGEARVRGPLLPLFAVRLATEAELQRREAAKHVLHVCGSFAVRTAGHHVGQSAGIRAVKGRAEHHVATAALLRRS